MQAAVKCMSAFYAIESLQPMSKDELWAFKQDKARLVAFVSREVRILLVAALAILGLVLR